MGLHRIKAIAPGKITTETEYSIIIRKVTSTAKRHSRKQSGPAFLINENDEPQIPDCSYGKYVSG